MARPIFYATNDSLVVDAIGYPVAGAPVRVYTRQTGGTQVTDLLAVADDGTLGAAIPDGVLRSDPNGLIPAFAGPDGGPTTVWGDHGLRGVRLALTADPGIGGGGSATPADGSITTAKLGDGAVTPIKLSFDPATQAELDTIASATTTALAGKTPTTRAITAGTGLTGGGDLTSDRTLAVAYGTTSTTAARGDDARIVGAAQATDVTTALASKAAVDLSNVTPATGRTALGLGTSATRGVGTSSGTVAAGDDTRITGAAQRAGATVTGAWDFTGASVTGIGAGLTAAQVRDSTEMVARYARVVTRDVRVYGAVGDGTTDDTAALNAALAAAGVGGAALIPPTMTLAITSKIDLDSRGIVGGGTITRTGGDAVINAIGARPYLHDVTLHGPGTSAAVYVNAGVTGIQIDGVTVTGTSGTPLGTAVHVNTTGVSGVLVQGCTCDWVTFGVLTDSGATDLTDVRILGNRFTHVTGDAVEINHPGDPYVAASSVIVDGNYLSAGEGANADSGFGVGIAGATRVVVSNNVFEDCRSQALHIEDDAAHVTAVGNVISGGGDGIWIIGGTFLSILGNAVYNVGGTGIHLVQDSASSASYFLISQNTIKGATGHGIRVNVDYTAVGIVEANIVADCGGDGLILVTTPTATALGPLTVRGNHLVGNDGWGMTLEAHTLQSVAGNVCDGNTLGPYRRPSTAAGILVPVHDPSGCKLDAAFTSNSTGWVTMFPAGSRMTGQLVVTASGHLNSADRCQQVWTVDWDGDTTLNYTPVGAEVSNGGTTDPQVRVNAGMLQVRFGHSGITNGTVTRIWARLSGVVLL
jgi:hypothetical protein